MFPPRVSSQCFLPVFPPRVSSPRFLSAFPNLFCFFSVSQFFPPRVSSPCSQPFFVFSSVYSGWILFHFAILCSNAWFRRIQFVPQSCKLLLHFLNLLPK